jgi:type VI secretion system protein ImpK
MSAPSTRVTPATALETTAPSLDHLELLYEGTLTAAVRVQSGRHQVHDIETFRARMEQTLGEIASTAARKGYDPQDVGQAKFAVVVFLDEIILTHDPCAAEWARMSLEEKLYGQRSGGELFFSRLEMLRANRDSQNLAEVLEVYYLCLLLGYEGKFAGGSKAELQLLMTNLRERIERIYGTQTEFSPDGALPDTPVAAAVPTDPLSRQAKLFALAALVLLILCYLGFSLNLGSRSAEIERAIAERLHQ